MKNKTYTDNKAFAVFDYTTQLARRETLWRWFSASGLAKAQDMDVTIGINFSDDMYYDSFSVSQENTIWVNNRLHLLDVPLRILPSNHLKRQPWRIRSLTCDTTCVDLHFTPLGSRADTKVHVLPMVAVEHVMPYGRLDGYIRLSSGLHIDIQDLFAVAGRHYALW